jgi:hypothetical protein
MVLKPTLTLAFGATALGSVVLDPAGSKLTSLQNYPNENLNLNRQLKRFLIT